MRIGEIPSSVKYRMDEQFKNCQFLVFQIQKILKIC